MGKEALGDKHVTPERGDRRLIKREQGETRKKKKKPKSGTPAVNPTWGGGGGRTGLKGKKKKNTSNKKSLKEIILRPLGGAKGEKESEGERTASCCDSYGRVAKSWTIKWLAGRPETDGLEREEKGHAAT